jgi:phosphoglycerol transferase
MYNKDNVVAIFKNSKLQILTVGSLILTAIISFVLHYYYGVVISDLAYPISNIYAAGDGRLMLAVFKMVVSGNWSLYNPPSSIYLSAPFEFKSYDFPLPMFSVWLYLKFLSFFTTDSTIIFNIFYLTTFYLNAFVMFFVLLKLRINVFLAISIALLFTFIPFHFWRLPHTFYAGYFFIPLWIYYLLLLQNKKPLFFKREIKSDRYRFDWSVKNLIIIGVLLFSSTWNFYYTFFFSFLLFFTGLASYIYHRCKYHIYSTLLVFVFVLTPFAVNMLPYKLYEMENGKNMTVAQRSPIEAETLGLKIIQLVFPADFHRSIDIVNFKSSYTDNTLLYNESADASMGFIGALGFLCLMGIVFFQRIFSSTLVRLSQLNLVALLLSTVGGFGVILAYLVTPQIRAYNRISVFIAALSFMALAIILNKTIKNSIYKNTVFIIISLFIAIFGIWDQTPSVADFKITKSLKQEYLSDRIFVKHIEEALYHKDGAKVAQFPYLYYPESTGVHQMGDYEQFYGYLHSNTIHWSYGAAKGREADAWYRELVREPIEEQIRILEEAGFSGLVINRNGYVDNGKQIENTVEHFLKVKPTISDNKTLVFYALTPRGKNVVVLPPWFTGFYEWEGADGLFRWAADRASIFWVNNENKPMEEKISFEVGSLIPRTMTIKLNTKIIDSFVISPGVQSAHTYTLHLTPGRNTIEFVTPEPSVKPVGKDTRKLSFSIANFNRISTSN